MKGSWVESFAVLREREFRLLWLGQTVSSLGDALVPLALTFAVLDLTGSAADLGLVFAAFMGARVIFMLAGGVWSDRLPRQLVMIAADIVRAGTQAVLAVAFFTDAVQVWHLMVASFLVGGASAFFGPASTGLVKTIVRPERLQEANALINLSQNAIQIFGPVSAGALVVLVGFGPIFAIDAVTFLASALFLLALRLPQRSEQPQRRSFLTEAREGLNEVLARTWLWSAFIVFSISNVTIAMYFVLGPLVVERELGGASDWGLLLTAGGIGGLLGSTIALRYKPARPLIPAFLLMFFVSAQLLALIPPLPVAALMLAAVLAVGSIAIGNALWDTMLQQHIPERSISRVSSLDWMISLVFMPLGYVVAGPLAETIGLDLTLALAAGAGVVANLGLLLVPSVRNLRRVEQLPEPVDPEPVAKPPVPVGQVS
ncbi:MAG: major facilitator superfamily 1 [Gaiellaceae bacterium]|nr:major facilitator superfamily 1 [Gaiellaceae bacterium]